MVYVPTLGGQSSRGGTGVPIVAHARSIAQSPHKPPGRAHLSDARWTHCTCRAAASGYEVLRWQPATAAHCTRVLPFIAAAARSTADAPHRLAAH